MKHEGSSEIAPPELDWSSVPRRAGGFILDLGFATPSRVPNWMLAAGTGAEPPVKEPGLPVMRGYVLSADTVGREDALLEYYRQMPELPPKRLRHETERFNCFSVDALLECPPQPGITMDTFGGGRGAAGKLLGALADLRSAPSIAYDNLDQGWALLVRIERDDVLLLKWDWESGDSLGRVQALRLARDEVARQASAAQARLDRLHSLLLAGIGVELWQAVVR